MIKVKNELDVPKEPHYAIIVYKTYSYVTDDGWEGNNHTVTVETPEHYTFGDKEEWIKTLKVFAATEKHFIGFEVSRVAKINTEVIIG